MTKTAKLPWMKFFPGDWSNDPALTLCAPATRGVWIDLICAMHDSDQCGELRGTADQLARFARCSTVEFVQAMTDIQTNRAAEVTERNGSYVICNRRMRAAYKLRKSVNDRVKRHRQRRRNGECNADEAQQRIEARGQNTNPPPPSGFKPNGPAAADWAAVEKKLLDFGLGKAGECVQAAAVAGANPQQIENLIEFWRGQLPAWGVGALCQRILNFRPGQSFFELWPPKAEAAAQADRRTAAHKNAEATRAKLAAEQREYDAAIKAEAAANARLEKAHGKKLDGMTRPQLLDFIAAAWPESWTLYHGRLPKDGPIPGALRRELLQAIDDRSAEGSQL